MLAIRIPRGFGQLAIMRGSKVPGLAQFPNEFRLAVESCRGSFQPAIGEQLTLIEAFDWSAFLRLVRFHRIDGLAWNALRQGMIGLPEDVAACLSQRASTIAAQNLVVTAECQSLLQCFEAGGVPLLFLKGVTLGALAYGNPALKSAIDIDLLIDPADLAKASELLRERGFRLVAPRESPDDAVLHSWHRLWKESVWAKSSPPLQIDLHTRAADNRRLIPSISVHSPRQLVDVGNGIRLPALAPDELFAYLAVHGASSAWFRLKWISDFAGVLHDSAEEGLRRLYRRSQELRAGRSAALALVLADHLFGTLQLAPSLKNELEQEKVVQRLFRVAFKLLTSDYREPTERRLGTLPIHRTQFALLPGLKFKFSELSRQARLMLSRPG